MKGFPDRRMRRLRAAPALRSLRRETRLDVRDLICPFFVVENPDQAGPIASLPGVARHALTDLDREIETILARGLTSLLLFGIPGSKDASASAAIDPRGIVPRAVERIKRVTDRLVVITDVCVCSYTDHGHCGVLRGESVDNDATLEVLAAMAVAHARAGADLIAPSAMMDGMVGEIRRHLDEAGLAQAGILSYAVKFASSFYGPFREAADSAPAFGDRRSYQMDPANAREALLEAALDINEGADLIMVKPALPYLDVISRVRQSHPEVPLVAYQVSGEYAMIKAAAANGWINENAAALESLLAIKRAGADQIITYFARDAATLLASASV